MTPVSFAVRLLISLVPVWLVAVIFVDRYDAKAAQSGWKILGALLMVAVLCVSTLAIIGLAYFLVWRVGV